MTSRPEVTAPEAVYAFISYSRSDSYDRRLAARLAEAIRLRKGGFFRDEESIEPGAEWRQELGDAICRATHFIVILSAESRQSQWVQKEIELALAERQRRGLVIIGVQRSRSTSFPDLEPLQLVEREVGEEIDAVMAALRLDRTGSHIVTSAQVRSVRAASRIAAELCDRRTEEDAFRDAFEAFCLDAACVVQAHFLVGAEDEQHDSFVDRLIATYLEPYASAFAERMGVPGQVVVKRIAWPQRFTPAQNRDVLLARMFDSFWPGYSHRHPADFSARGFAEAMSTMAGGVFVAVHTIGIRRWDTQMPKLLEECLRFWRDVGVRDSRHKMILFFNVCLDPDAGVAAHEPVRKAVAALAERVSQAKKQPLPVSVVDLPCVRRSHVRAWFNDQDDAVFAHFNRTCAELFSERDCQPMARVEEVLRAVQLRSKNLREVS